mmetsp:Transcript_37609/g.69436  ORF Transcript_37609/g.69436 Transcript_37609/m.69436 type:complete len:258 (+) Transcript_37609:290-1063(+)
MDVSSVCRCPRPHKHTSLAADYHLNNASPIRQMASSCLCRCDKRSSKAIYLSRLRHKLQQGWQEDVSDLLSLSGRGLRCHVQLPETLDQICVLRLQQELPWISRVQVKVFVSFRKVTLPIVDCPELARLQSGNIHGCCGGQEKLCAQTQRSTHCTPQLPRNHWVWYKDLRVKVTKQYSRWDTKRSGLCLALRERQQLLVHTMLCCKPLEQRVRRQIYSSWRRTQHHVWNQLGDIFKNCHSYAIQPSQPSRPLFPCYI